MNQLIPQPTSVQPAGGVFALTATTAIVADPATAEVTAIADRLAVYLRPATGYPLPVLAADGAPASNRLLLTLDAADAALGDEGYALHITPNAVTLTAHRPAGLFYGVQTLRQLLPPTIESAAPQPGPWSLPAGTIRDTPRFAWRGVMLDVARHFFAPADVKRVIDLAAAYKLNRLHLHLSDDQGWRIEIKSWPELTRVGGQTAVGGGPGGYYTQAEYADIVAYAAARYVTVVPEIDMPGHTNAAQAAYAELNADGQARSLYSGIEVGFSSLAIDQEITYQFVDDVVGELAALTPGDFIHIGGDEALSTDKGDYVRFIERVEGIVTAHGKRLVGWEEIGQAELEPTSIAQHWAPSHAAAAVAQGAKVILSPASRIYLDMKYDESTPLGLNWAGYVSVRAAYDWEPATLLAGVGEADVLGVEAALWSETLTTIDDIETMLFPRLPGVAEVAWSAAGRDWDGYRQRLAAHGARLEEMGVNFHRSEEVEWQ
jgi:hexosaminidase